MSELSPEHSQSSDEMSDNEQVNELNSKLIKENERLTQQVASLKVQLRETIEFQTKNEELYKKNLDLQTELRKSQATIDDLNCRLSINLKLLEESKNKETQIKPRLDLQMGTDLIERERRKFAKQITKLNAQISSNEELYLQQKQEITNLHDTINKIITATSTKYNVVFKDVEALISFIEQIPENSTIESATSVPEIAPLFDPRLIRKIQKLKKQLRNTRFENMETESKLNDMFGQFEEFQKQANDQIQKLNNELNESKHKANLAEIEYKHQLDQIHADNIALKANLEKSNKKLEDSEKEVSKLQAIVMPNNNIQEELEYVKKENDQLNNFLKDRDYQLVSVKGQMEVLNSQIKTLESQLQASKKKNEKSQKDYNDISATVDSLRIENSALKLQKSSLEEQIRANETKLESIKTQLKQAQTDISVLEADKKRLLASIKALEDNGNEMRKEQKDLSDQRDKLIEIVQKQNKASSAMEEQCDAQTTELKLLRCQLEDLKCKLSKEMAKPPVEVSLPVTAWFTDDLPRDLCSKIAPIAKKEISSQTKLKSVLTTITEYYNKALAQTEQKLKDVNEQLTKLQVSTDKFASKIGSFFGFDGISAETVANDPYTIKELERQITKLQNENTESNVVKSRFETEINAINRKLETNSASESLEMIEKLINKVENLQEELKKEKSNNTKAKQLFKSMEESKDNDLQKKDNLISDLTKNVDDLKIQKENLENQINRNQKTIQTLQKSIEEAKIQYEDELAKIKRVHQKDIQSITHKYENKEKEVYNAVNQKQSEISRIKEQNSNLERTIAALQSKVDEIPIIKKAHEEAMHKLVEESENSEKIIRENSEIEKNELKKAYEARLAESKQQSEEIIKAHEESSGALKEATQRIQDLTQKLVESSLMIDDLKSRVAIANEECQRQIRINDMKTRATLLSQEMHYQSRIDEERANFNREKRKIIGFVAQQFRKFFDAHCELDDNSLRTTVNAVRDELDKYSKSDINIRKILMIGETDSVEDAVSKLVLSIYQK